MNNWAWSILTFFIIIFCSEAAYREGRADIITSGVQCQIEIKDDKGATHSFSGKIIYKQHDEGLING